MHGVERSNSGGARLDQFDRLGGLEREAQDVPQWWSLPGALPRYVRDVLISEMSQLRPSGWRWPSAQAEDVHLVDDLGADSLEMLALSAAMCESVDLSTPQELSELHERPTWRGWTAVVRQRLQRSLCEVPAQAQGSAQAQARVRFSTSGSTGRPQRRSHALCDLEQEMGAMLDLLKPQLRPGFRVLTAVRSNHIYGFLFSLLLPAVAARGRTADVGDGVDDQRLGRPAPEVIDLTGLPAAAARSLAQEGDLVVGFPDWWGALNRSDVGGASQWARGVVGLSSTAPCPTSVAHGAMEGGLARWIEIYGSTETAGVGWRDDPTRPFTLHHHWRRVTQGLVEKSRKDMKPAPSNGSGPAGPSGPFGLERQDASGQWDAPIELCDHLQWLDDTHFVPLARRDGLVQVAGVNVDPGQVQQKIMLHPSVAQAAVRLHATPSGMRLKAFVVPARDLFEADERAVAAELREHLRTWCSRHLVPAARPFDIRIGAALPRNEMGKLCDWEPGWQL